MSRLAIIVFVILQMVNSSQLQIDNCVNLPDGSRACQACDYPNGVTSNCYWTTTPTQPLAHDRTSSLASFESIKRVRRWGLRRGRHCVPEFSPYVFCDNVDGVLSNCRQRWGCGSRSVSTPRQVGTALPSECRNTVSGRAVCGP